MVAGEKGVLFGHHPKLKPLDKKTSFVQLLTQDPQLKHVRVRLPTPRAWLLKTFCLVEPSRLLAGLPVVRMVLPYQKAFSRRFVDFVSGFQAKLLFVEGGG